jgi:hypothetical protein
VWQLASPSSSWTAILRLRSVSPMCSRADVEAAAAQDPHPSPAFAHFPIASLATFCFCVCQRLTRPLAETDASSPQAAVRRQALVLSVAFPVQDSTTLQATIQLMAPHTSVMTASQQVRPINCARELVWLCSCSHSCAHITTCSRANSNAARLRTPSHQTCRCVHIERCQRIGCVLRLNQEHCREERSNAVATRAEHPAAIVTVVQARLVAAIGAAGLATQLSDLTLSGTTRILPSAAMLAGFLAGDARVTARVLEKQAFVPLKALFMQSCGHGGVEASVQWEQLLRLRMGGPTRDLTITPQTS